MLCGRQPGKTKVSPVAYDWDGRQTRRLKLIQGVCVGMVVVAASVLSSLIVAWATGSA